MDHHTVNLISIPLFTSAIGYLTNWSGVWMLFNPIRFAGLRVPGLKAVVSVLPRKIQQVPGFAQGGISLPREATSARSPSGSSSASTRGSGATCRRG